ncbi:diacylglycerol-binding protein [Mycolicibacterium vaccae]|uniref:diacylglycerol-binding protein n=1 Tax=Mycolicibacterium vaccae TaxID=1810 RepID=UPI003D06B1A8
MKLRLWQIVFLFVLGGTAALVGDHSHVVTGTTFYRTDAVPYLWSSPLWFPLLVGGATAALGELRLHLAARRTTVTTRQVVGGVAAVVGMYVTTALVHSAPVVPVTALLVAAAVIVWCVLGDGSGAVCGAVAAVVGPAVEIALAAAGLFGYGADADQLFGVAPFLVPLYFAFGVVVAALGERMRTNRASGGG